jgi:hypothetical protein
MVCINTIAVNEFSPGGLNHQEADQFEVFNANQVLGQRTGFTRGKQAVHLLLFLMRHLL